MENERIFEQSRISYVDLPAIIGGTILALAISIVLFGFGNAVGLGMSPTHEWDNTRAWGQVIGIGLWSLWVQVLAAVAGGYFAGRMRRPVAGSLSHEREMRDGAHGLTVWAMGTVAVAIAMGVTAGFTALAVDPNTVMPQKTPDVVRMEHNIAIISAFTVAATCLVAAVASWWAATCGGEHRDHSVDHSREVSFKKR